MTDQPTDDPELRRYKAALEAMYGDQIDRVVLFGSRARGDAHAESNYDVAVFLQSMPDRWRELDPWPIWATGSLRNLVCCSTPNPNPPALTSIGRP